MTKKAYKQKYFSLPQLRIQTGKFYLRIYLLLKWFWGWITNILGVHWKIQLLGKEDGGRGGGVQKTNIEAGGGQFADLREGAWQEREGGVFEGSGGGLIPQYKLWRCNSCLWKHSEIYLK